MDERIRRVRVLSRCNDWKAAFCITIGYSVCFWPVFFCYLKHLSRFVERSYRMSSWSTPYQQFTSSHACCFMFSMGSSPHPPSRLPEQSCTISTRVFSVYDCTNSLHVSTPAHISMTAGLMRRAPASLPRHATQTLQGRLGWSLAHDIAHLRPAAVQVSRPQVRFLANVRDDRLSEVWFTGSYPRRQEPFGLQDGGPERPPDERTLNMGKSKYEQEPPHGHCCFATNHSLRSRGSGTSY